MALAPVNSQYLLAAPDVQLPQSRKLTSDPVGGNLQFVDGGAGGNYTLTPTLNLLDLANMSSTAGFVASTAGTMVARTLTSDSSLTIINPQGDFDDPYFSVVDNTSIQMVNVSSNGAATTDPSSLLNFISGPNATVNAVYNSGASRTDITISADDSIPATGSVIYTAAATGHSFNIGTLASGLLKFDTLATVATPATAVPDVDYMVPTASLVDLAGLTAISGSMIAAVSGHWDEILPGSTGQVMTMITGDTAGWVTPGATAAATYLCQTGDALPTNGINVGAADAFLGIGTESPSFPLDLLTTLPTALNIVNNPGNNSTCRSKFTNYGGNAGYSSLSLYTARGTLAAPRRTPEFADLGGIDVFGAYAASGVANATFTPNPVASIKFSATQTYTSTLQGSEIIFYTTPIGSDTAEGNVHIYSNGFVGIGAIPTAPLHILTSEETGLNVVNNPGDNSSGISKFTTYGGGAGYSSLSLFTAHGTLAAPRRIPEFGDLGGIDVYGAYASGSGVDAVFPSDPVARISFSATQTYTSTLQGSKINFYTTPIGSATAETNVNIYSNGFVGIGATPTAPLTILSTTTVTIPEDGSTGLYVTTNASDAGALHGGPIFRNFGGDSNVALLSANGTLAEPIRTHNLDIIGSIGGYGAYADNDVDPADFSTLPEASVSFYATQDHTDTHRGAGIAFSDTGNSGGNFSSVIANISSGGLAIGKEYTAPITSFEIVSSGQVTAPYTTAAGMVLTNDPQTLPISCDTIFISYSGTDDTIDGLGSNLSLVAAKNQKSVPRRLIAGDIIGGLKGYGAYAAAPATAASFPASPSAKIQYVAREAFTATAQGTSIDFYTTPLTTATSALAMKLDTTGNLGIGGPLTAAVSYPLSIYSIKDTGTLQTTAAYVEVDTSGTTSLNAGMTISAAYAGGSGGPSVLFKAARNTIASPQALTTNDYLFKIIPLAYGSAGSTTAGYGSSAPALFGCQALEPFVTGTTPAKGNNFVFLTAPIGSATRALTVDIRGGGTTAAMVGIGTAPTHTLHLVNDDAYKPTTAVWTNVSDARIKTDVKDISGALDIINALQPRTFKYTQEHVEYITSISCEGAKNPYCAETVSYGFIADEVEKVLPKCVKVSNDVSGEHENLKTLNLSDVNVLVVQAIKELSAKVALLEAKLGL